MWSYIIFFVVFIVILCVCIDNEKIYKENDRKMVEGLNYNYENIDQILYINLKERKDRKIKLLEELTRIEFPDEKITRIDAIKHEKGAIGCAMSHYKALLYAKTKNYKNVLILEDDMKFIESVYKVKKAFKDLQDDFKNDSFNVMFISGRLDSYEKYKDSTRYVRILKMITATSYIVDSKYYDTLLQNLKESSEGMQKYGPGHGYENDVYWWRLYTKDVWLMLIDKIGFQRPGFSNIIKCFRNIGY